MADYRLAEGGGVIFQNRVSIPPDEKNRDWRRYQDWLAKGNTPDALVLPAAPERPEATARAAVEASNSLPDLKAALSAYFAAKG